jgi:uncharacterized RDD family membrane protein YckC
VASESGKPPVARLLSAGARGADRVAHAAGVDRVLDEAVEEAIVRALNSPTIGRAIERAIEERTAATSLDADEVAQIVKQVLESQAAERAWDEVLRSQQAQMLVERIAGAPEIREAIAEQTGGLITDIGVRLTKLTEALDDAVERVVSPRGHDSEIDQAGMVTRLAAAAVDFGLLFVAYSLISSMLASVIPFAFGSHLSLPVALVLVVLGAFAASGVLAAFWALAGQTPGMRFLSIRLTHEGSHEISARCAVTRVLWLVPSLIPAGLGFFAITRDPERRAWHDRWAHTEVVYDAVEQGAPHAGDDSELSGASRAGRRR